MERKNHLYIEDEKLKKEVEEAAIKFIIQDKETFGLLMCCIIKKIVEQMKEKGFVASVKGCEPDDR